jgi:1-acyl-sn-glycerol-3-phosphate acyltransferase
MRDEPLYRGLILFGRALFRGLGLRRVIQGGERLDRPGGAVLAITHFGYLDFALAEWAVWRCTGRMTRFLVTAAAFRHPLAGPVLRGMRHIPVDRAAGTAAYQRAVIALRAGELVGIFPEGQVNHDDVGPLKTGAVRMAAEAGVPVVPIVVWGGQRILTKGRRFSLRRAWRSRIVIMVGEPIPPGTGAGRDAGTEAVVQDRTAVLRSRLQELLAQAKLSTDVPPEKHSGR